MALLVLINAADADGAGCCAGHQRRDVPQKPAASHEDTPLTREFADVAGCRPPASFLATRMRLRHNSLSPVSADCRAPSPNPASVRLGTGRPSGSRSPTGDACRRLTDRVRHRVRSPVCEEPQRPACGALGSDRSTLAPSCAVLATLARQMRSWLPAGPSS